jgi:hypothetical protein
MSLTNPVELPHFDWPARLDATGKFVVDEQNSTGDVASCVTNAVSCPPGALLGNPTFGVPSALFQTQPINMQPILTAVQAIEPRVQQLSAVAATAAVEAGIITVLGLTPEEGLYPGAGLYPQETTEEYVIPPAAVVLGIGGGVIDTSVIQSSDGS